MKRTKKSSLTKRFISGVLNFGFVCYIGLLLYFLFFSDKYGRIVGYEEYRYNLQLFKEIKRFAGMGGRAFFINIIGNVGAFVPLGFFIPVMYREQRKDKVIIGHYFRSFFFVVLLGILFSFMVETIQLIEKVGCFDVDDMFLNTLGIAIGYIGYVIAKKCIGMIGEK